MPEVLLTHTLRVGGGEGGRGGDQACARDASHSHIMGRWGGVGWGVSSLCRMPCVGGVAWGMAGVCLHCDLLEAACDGSRSSSQQADSRSSSQHFYALRPELGSA